MSKAATDLYTISIDFWEQYDPSEVGTKGFALIGSELFRVPAICYLCGSAGKEPVSDAKLFTGCFKQATDTHLCIIENCRLYSRFPCS